MNLRDLDEQLQRAARLEAAGLQVHSAELTERALAVRDFKAAGGNRAMRRAAQRRSRKRGR
jgi:hypothetical protein